MEVIASAEAIEPALRAAKKAFCAFRKCDFGEDNGTDILIEKRMRHARAIVNERSNGQVATSRLCCRTGMLNCVR